MIIKFDHIAYTCQKKDKEKVFGSLKNYKPVFMEEGVENLIIKKQLMSNWQENHDISLWEASEMLPIEITAYDMTKNGIKKYDVNGNIIIAATNSFSESYGFYKAIGFKETKGYMELSTLMGISPIRISIYEDESCAALYSKHTLDSLGGVLSGICDK